MLSGLRGALGGELGGGGAAGAVGDGEDDPARMRRRMQELELQNERLLDKLATMRMDAAAGGTATAGATLAGVFKGIRGGAAAPKAAPSSKPEASMENDMLRVQLESLRQAYAELTREKGAVAPQNGGGAAASELERLQQSLARADALEVQLQAAEASQAALAEELAHARLNNAPGSELPATDIAALELALGRARDDVDESAAASADLRRRVEVAERALYAAGVNTREGEFDEVESKARRRDALAEEQEHACIIEELQAQLQEAIAGRSALHEKLEEAELNEWSIQATEHALESIAAMAEAAEERFGRIEYESACAEDCSQSSLEAQFQDVVSSRAALEDKLAAVELERIDQDKACAQIAFLEGIVSIAKHDLAERERSNSELRLKAEATDQELKNAATQAVSDAKLAETLLVEVEAAAERSKEESLRLASISRESASAVQSLEAQLQDAAASRSELQSQLAVAESRTASSDPDLVLKHTREGACAVESLEAQLKDAIASRSELEEKLAMAESAMAGRSALIEQTSRLEESLATTKAELVERDRSSIELLRQAEAALQALKDIDADNTATDRSPLEEQISFLEESLATVKDELAERDQFSRELQRQGEAGEQALTDSASQALSKVEVVEARVAELEAAAGRHDVTLGEASITRERVENVESLEAQLQDAVSSRYALQHALEEAKLEAAGKYEADSQVIELEATVATAKEELAAGVAAHGELQRRAETTEQALKDMASQAASQAEIAEARHVELKESRRQVSSASEKVSLLEDLEVQLHDAVASRAALQKQLATAESQTASSEQALAQSSNLEDALAAARNELTDRERQGGEFQHRAEVAERLKADTAQLAQTRAARITELEAACSQSEGEAARQKAAASERLTILEDLEDQCRDLEKKLRQATGGKTALEEELTAGKENAERRLTVLEEILVTSRAELAEHGQTNRELQVQAGAAEQAAAEAEQRLAEAAAAQPEGTKPENGSEEQLREAAAEMETLRRQLEAARNHANDNQAVLATTRGEVAAAVEARCAADTEEAALYKQLMAAAESRQALEGRLEEAEARVEDAVRGAQQDVEEQLRQAAADREVLLSRLASSEAATAEATSQSGAATARAAAAEAAAAEATARSNEEAQEGSPAAAAAAATATATAAATAAAAALAEACDVRLRREVEQLREELRRATEQRRGLQRRLRERSAATAPPAVAPSPRWTSSGAGEHAGGRARGGGGSGGGGGFGAVLYMQQIDELEAENARLEDVANGASALYVPKIQELEDEVSEVQRELQQALDSQRALQEDLADKGAVIRELLRRSGLTAKTRDAPIQRMLKAVRTVGAGAAGATGTEATTGSGVTALRAGEMERTIERLLQEAASLRGSGEVSG